MAKSTSAAAVAQDTTEATVVADTSNEVPAVTAVEQESPAAEQWRDKLYTSRVLVLSDTRTVRVVAGLVSVEPADEELRDYLQQRADFELAKA